MSLSANYPALAPNLLLDFSNSAVVDPRVTVTRASTATYYNGLTYAKAEENLLVQSQTFQTTWAATNVSVSADATVAPDGTATADTIAETTANATHGLGQAITVLSGFAYVYSVFLKKGDGATAPDIVQLSTSTTGFGSIYANFNLSTGSVGTSSGVTAAITSVGNGWYRCSITATTSSAGSTNVFVVFTNNNDGLGRIPSYAGQTTSNVFIWGAQLEQRSAVTAYTATTTQPITNYIQALQTAQNNVPRIDHNPVTNATLGLLIEEQRTNSLTYSNDFANAAWTTNSLAVTPTANQEIAPDGTLTADKATPTAASSAHIVRQFTSITIGNTYTQSFFVKAAGYNFVQFTLSTGFDGGGALYRNFNLSNGTAGNGNLSAGATTISSVGNGWYRITITATATSTSAGGRINLNVLDADTASANPVYTGDGYSGIFIWGAQLEAGAFVTSYIPTTTTALTRNADDLRLTGTNFSSWYSASQGTLFTEGTAVDNIIGSTSRVYAELGNAAATERFLVEARSSTSTRARAVTGGVTAISSLTYDALGINAKVVGAYGLDGVTCTVAGLTPVTTASAVPAPDTMFIGSNYIGTGAAIINGHIQRIAYYPLRNTNAQLQALTG